MIGALIGLGTAAYGAHQSKKAQNQANAMNMGALSEVLGTLGWWQSPTYKKDDWAHPIPTVFGQALQGFQSAGRQLTQGNKALVSGYQNAARSIAMTGAGAQRNIIRQGTQSLAQQRAGLAQAGLSNSSLGSQLARANRADTASQTMQLAGQMAPLRAQAQANIGEAQYRGQAGLAALTQNKTQFMTGLAQQRLNALLGQNISAGPSMLEQLGPGGLAAIGNFGSQLGSGIAGLFSGNSSAGAGHQGQAPTQQQYLNWWGQD